MPDIRQSLQGKDIQFLQQIAAIWGIELQANDLRSTIQQLAAEMDQKEQFLEIIEAFSEESRNALLELAQTDGKLPWTLFLRKYGDIRVMGVARRERERPNLHPANATEVLWYSGLLSKAFFNIQKEPLEYAYLPDEFFHFLSQQEPPIHAPHLPGRPATSSEKAKLIPANDHILDHMTTLLASIRTGQPIDSIPWNNKHIPVAFLLQIAQSTHLLDENNTIQPAQVRQFMESDRADALLTLANGWLSNTFNDLRQLPGFVFEGPWQNQPDETRQYLLAELSSIPKQTWWSFSAFLSYIKQNNPDFQRPAGDYDSWYIRRNHSEDYLRGIQHWDEIDGALIRRIICQHMHWLGLTDLGTTTSSSLISAFRFSAWAENLLSNIAPDGLRKEQGEFKVLTDGTIQVPSQVSRAIRYQVARFCHLLQETDSGYKYQIQPDSLSSALKAGLKIEQFINLLQKSAQKPIPPSIFNLLDNWKNDGVQVSFAPVMLLTTKDPHIINHLLSSRARKYLGERLNEYTILINEKQIKLVMSILTELGYLSNVQTTGLVKIRKE
ncbi:MAG: helicase-associated domain-containing protein [Anaerolineaceae bacterium]|nr:helicase-associated domain-containing protein [Anaerolineaceae bacterium]